MRTIRAAADATPASCVTRMMVCPPACRRHSSSMTSRPPSESRAPVGSSASNNVGSLASARAMASRCRCPPESRPGTVPALSPIPSRSRRSRARLSAILRFRPAMTAGSATFSKTVMPSRRLKNWKTIPMWRRRSCESSSSVRPVTSSPATVIVPSSATSSPAIKLRSVDLPHPEGPISATKSPDGTTRFAPRSARTGAFSASNVFRTFSATKASMSASFSRRDVGTTSVAYQFVCDHGGLASLDQLRRQSDRLPSHLPGVNGALGDHDFACIRQLLQALGHVDGVPDKGVFQPLLGAEQRRRGLPGREAEAQAERRQALPFPPPVEQRLLLVHGLRRHHGSVGVVDLFERRTEHGHHRVSDELHHRAVLPQDGVVHGRPMDVELPGELARVCVLGDGGVRADVAHENRDDDPFGLTDLAPVPTKLLGQAS